MRGGCGELEWDWMACSSLGGVRWGGGGNIGMGWMVGGGGCRGGFGIRALSHCARGIVRVGILERSWHGELC